MKLLTLVFIAQHSHTYQLSIIIFSLHFEAKPFNPEGTSVDGVQTDEDVEFEQNSEVVEVVEEQTTETMSGLPGEVSSVYPKF